MEMNHEKPEDLIKISPLRVLNEKMSGNVA
jgi:hypothetical protein